MTTNTEAISPAVLQDPLAITKERVKDWHACTDGYRWFLGKFPQGGQFADVYAALQADKRYDDSSWLSDKVFAELDAPTRVQQTVKLAGADTAKIEQAAKDGAEAATTGEGANAATTGEGAIAVALGQGSRAKASAGGAIVLVWRAPWPNKEFKVFASKVGENGIKPDTFYSLNEHGVPVEEQA